MTQYTMLLIYCKDISTLIHIDCKCNAIASIDSSFGMARDFIFRIAEHEGSTKKTAEKCIPMLVSLILDLYARRHHALPYHLLLTEDERFVSDNDRQESPSAILQSPIIKLRAT